MANVIKIKRGPGVPTKDVLTGGELGWNSSTGMLYIGRDGDPPVGIGAGWAS
jgi:hypothetical protein